VGDVNPPRDIHLDISIYIYSPALLSADHFLSTCRTISIGYTMGITATRLVILSSLIHSAITDITKSREDKFSKCYDNKHANSALYYGELMTSSTAMCALVCLPDADCAAFDVCPIGHEDRNENDKMCKMRNSSDVEQCAADEQYGLASRCESYMRVSINTKYCSLDY
jgi:hypothetical protein